MKDLTCFFENKKIIKKKSFKFNDIIFTCPHRIICPFQIWIHKYNVDNLAPTQFFARSAKTVCSVGLKIRDIS